MSEPAPRIPRSVVVGLFIASLVLRPQILIVGPLLPMIRTDLDLPASVAGLLTTIPVLCMGLMAPFGPRIAAWLGPERAFAACLAAIAGFGALRAAMPSVPLLLAATLVIGIGIGAAGAIPSMIVARRIPSRPALGTGAYAGGIVAGSTIAAAVAVPLAVGDDWRRTFLLVSLVSFVALGAWLVLVGVRDRRPTGGLRRAIRLPWSSSTAWLLIVLFGLQSILFYGVVAWLPNAYVERGWSTADAGALLAIFNGIGLITTIGVPLVADRLGTRRLQLLLASIAALIALVGITLVPDPAVLWVTILGLALGVVFPLVLTLPLDVSDDPGTTGAAAALMLLGGYLLAAFGPIALGAARDATGDFTVSLWLLVVVAGAMVAACTLLSPDRLRRGIARVPVLSSPA